MLTKVLVNSYSLRVNNLAQLVMLTVIVSIKGKQVLQLLRFKYMENHKDPIITVMDGTGFITTQRSSVYSSSKLDLDRIDLPELKTALFPEKKVVKEKPLTIDQMVTSATNRLNVWLEAECNWLAASIKKEFAALRFEQLKTFPGWGSITNNVDISKLNFKKDSIFPGISIGQTYKYFEMLPRPGITGMLYRVIDTDETFICDGIDYLKVCVPPDYKLDKIVIGSNGGGGTCG